MILLHQDPIRATSRSAWARLGPLALVFFVSGCSLITPFGDFEFERVDGSARDGSLDMDSRTVGDAASMDSGPIDAAAALMDAGAMVDSGAATDSGAAADSGMVDADRPVDSGADSGTFHTLAVELIGDGTGVVTSDDGDIQCGSACSTRALEGARVTLRAVATGSSVFLGWSGGGCSGTGEVCVVSMDAPIAISAAFGPTNSIVVSVSGNGAGTVRSSPGGIVCPTDCSESFGAGTTVTLTAAAGAESRFAGWSGACSGTGSCMIAANMAAAVVATFELERYRLTISRTGTGTVVSTPAGINCGSACSTEYDSGTMVTLRATPSTGSQFSGWSGAGCSGTTTCTVTMSMVQEVVASFASIPQTLEARRAGTGSGTITSSPTGISCGSDCTQAYNYGTRVSLTATATAGSLFAGWSGDCSGTSATCSVTMTATRSAVATFNATPTSLSCTSVTNASNCTNGEIAQIDFGTGLTAATCRSRCQTEMPRQGMSQGCWIIAADGDGHCYCRSGVLNTGVRMNPGGTCGR